jgi:hypothetical protein
MSVEKLRRHFHGYSLDAIRSELDWIGQGRLPRPRAWLDSELCEWIMTQINETYRSEIYPAAALATLIGDQS